MRGGEGSPDNRRKRDTGRDFEFSLVRYVGAWLGRPASTFVVPVLDVEPSERRMSTSARDKETNANQGELPL